MRHILSIILMLAMAVPLTACGQGSSATDRGDSTMILAAASSLETIFVEGVLPLFEEQNPGTNVIGAFDASGRLQLQIEAGLDAAVYISASPQFMDHLVDSGLVNEADVILLLENTLVLITGVHSGTAVTSFETVLDAETLAVCDPASVSAGEYTQEVFTSLGMWEAVEQVASLGTNVPEVLNQVAEGSAEVGIVYATDAALLPDTVRVIAEAPEGSMGKVVYPAAVLRGSAGLELGERFMAFLQTEDAQAVFESYGFKPYSP